MLKPLQALLLKGIDLIETMIGFLGTTITSFSNLSANNSIVKQLSDIFVLIGVSLLVLFFMLEFMNKCTTNIDWINLPNVLLFLIKGVALKGLVTNANDLVTGIHEISKSIFTDISSADLQITGDYGFSVLRTTIEELKTGIKETYIYLFYGLLILLILGILVYTFVVLFQTLVAILVELNLMKCIAPLTLATISSSYSSIAIRYLQNFIAVCLQNTIVYISIIIVNSIMGTITNAPVFNIHGTIILGFLVSLLCLVTAVKTSGSISRNLVGL